jgi:RNA polymerase sigma-70 factor (ECF subfamily)
MEVENLVRRAQEGDGESFLKLIEPEYLRLLSYMRSRIRKREDARDLAQDVITAALEDLRTLRKPASFTYWLWAIARNVVSNYHKDPANAQPSATEEQEAGLAARDDPHSAAYDLWELVDSLPADLREVIHLKYAARFTHAEMAEMLGVAEATVNKRLGDARKLLRQRWRGGDGTGELPALPTEGAPPAADAAPTGP